MSPTPPPPPPESSFLFYESSLTNGNLELETYSRDFKAVRPLSCHSIQNLPRPEEDALCCVSSRAKKNLTTTRTAHHPRPQTSAPEEGLDIQTPVKAKTVPSVVAPQQHTIFRSPDHTLTVSNLTFLITTKCLFITNWSS
ncbi:hypothetical protein RUM43_001573 [Polyplax serrata]|uniref:Uncharacterized protein n=1 Tax=Polyplax serrata TaxID=468196 RepID=A0AAN8XU60_POLSC